MQNEYWCMNFQHIAFRCKIASTMQIKYVMMCCISACCEMSWFLFDFASAGLDWWYCIFLSQQRSLEGEKIETKMKLINIDRLSLVCTITFIVQSCRPYVVVRATILHDSVYSACANLIFGISQLGIVSTSPHWIFAQEIQLFIQIET